MAVNLPPLINIPQFTTSLEHNGENNVVILSEAFPQTVVEHNCLVMQFIQKVPSNHNFIRIEIWVRNSIENHAGKPDMPKRTVQTHQFGEAEQVISHAMNSE
uniref:Uncharacterized protein n=1 Tax=Opuntia streptacantha TaxID=393608 RepID=A0A7C8ZYT6_OPUST